MVILKQDKIRDLFGKAMGAKSCNKACQKEGVKLEVSIKVIGCDGDCQTIPIDNIDNLVLFADTGEGVVTKIHGKLQFQTMVQALLNARIIGSIHRVEMMQEMEDPLLGELLNILSKK